MVSLGYHLISFPDWLASAIMFPFLNTSCFSAVFKTDFDRNCREASFFILPPHLISIILLSVTSWLGHWIVFRAAQCLFPCLHCQQPPSGSARPSCHHAVLSVRVTFSALYTHFDKCQWNPSSEPGSDSVVSSLLVTDPGSRSCPQHWEESCLSCHLLTSSDLPPTSACWDYRHEPLHQTPPSQSPW